MALINKIESRSNSSCPDGYEMLSEIKFNNINKTGSIEYAKWEDKGVRTLHNQGKCHVGLSQILIGEEEIIEIIEKTNSEDAETGIITGIAYTDIKTELDALIKKLYILTKKYKIRFQDEISNLKKAKDDL